MAAVERGRAAVFYVIRPFELQTASNCSAKNSDVVMLQIHRDQHDFRFRNTLHRLSSVRSQIPDPPPPADRPRKHTETCNILRPFLPQTSENPMTTDSLWIVD